MLTLAIPRSSPATRFSDFDFDIHHQRLIAFLSSPKCLPQSLLLPHCRPIIPRIHPATGLVSLFKVTLHLLAGSCARLWAWCIGAGTSPSRPLYRLLLSEPPHAPSSCRVFAERTGVLRRCAPPHRRGRLVSDTGAGRAIVRPTLRTLDPVPFHHITITPFAHCSQGCCCIPPKKPGRVGTCLSTGADIYCS